MDAQEIYAKTEAAARELKERKLNLPIALRSLLIMVNGERTVADLLRHAQLLKLDINALKELERNHLIAKKFSAPSAVATKEEAVTPVRSEDEVQRFLDAQKQMSDAVNQHLGFRGYGMMMRLQRAANLRDLHDLLPDFQAALAKRIGVEAAAPVLSRVNNLINPGA